MKKTWLRKLSVLLTIAALTVALGAGSVALAAQAETAGSVEAAAAPTETAAAEGTALPEAGAVQTPAPAPAAALPLAGLKIGIDPGHQLHANSDTEPVAPGSKEKKPKVSAGTSGRATKVPEHVVNLIVSLQLRDALTALGAEVKMTRETADVDISNIERAQMMNEWGADLVLRLHCNGVSSAKANGIGLYVRKTGTLSKETLAYAKIILPLMVEQTGAESDGVFRRDTYSGLNWSEVPSILVEMGYMTNKQEDINLNDPAYQQKLVAGMALGVAACFDRALEPADAQAAAATAAASAATTAAPGATEEPAKE